MASTTSIVSIIKIRYRCTYSKINPFQFVVLSLTVVNGSVATTTIQRENRFLHLQISLTSQKSGLFLNPGSYFFYCCSCYSLHVLCSPEVHAWKLGSKAKRQWDFEKVGFSGIIMPPDMER